MANEYNYELGSLDINDEIMTKLMNSGDIDALKAYLQQGYDPRTFDMIKSGTQQYQDLMNAPAAYGRDELNTFRDLISGDFFTNEMAGSFRERIRKEMQPTQNAMMADLSARGLATSGGEMSSALGKMANEQNAQFQDIASQNFLQAIGYGTAGLGAADTSMLNRAQTSYGMGADLRNFLENSQMNRVGIGANLASMDQNMLMNLLQLNQGTRQYQQSQPSDLQSALGSAIGFGIQAFTPAPIAALNMFGGGGGIGNFGSNIQNQFTQSGNSLAGM